MKLAAGLLGVAVVAVVVAVVLAVSHSKDDLPNDLRGCLQRGQATIVRGPVNLGSARREIDAGTLRRVKTSRRDGAMIVIFAGQRFRLLVLGNEHSPPLGGDLPRRVYEHADAYPVAAIEVDPIRGILTGCADIVAG